MAPSAEVRHTFHGYGEINSDLNADTGPARSRAISRLPLRQRVAPGFSRPAFLTGPGEGFSEVPPGSRPVARAGGVGRLAGPCGSGERFSAVGLVGALLRAAVLASVARGATAARSHF